MTIKPIIWAEKRELTYFQLKLIATATMLIDHLGFFSGNQAMRIIGRSSFFLYAFLVANGLKHTRNKTKYLIRLFAFGAISEAPYNYMISGSFTYKGSANVFITLGFGLLFLIAYMFIRDKIANRIARRATYMMTLLGCCAATEWLEAEYGWFGVVMIGVFAIYDPAITTNRIKCLWLLALINGLYAVYRVLTTSSSIYWILIEFSGMFALIPISFYKGKSGLYGNKLLKEIMKYSFYLFYPTHMLILRKLWEIGTLR